MRRHDYLAMAVLSAVVFTPRIADLDAFINVDGCAFWLDRTLAFCRALYTFSPQETLISGHPGVTFMLLSGGSLSLAALFKYGTLSFGAYKSGLLFFAKLPIALTTGAMVLFVYIMLRRHFRTVAFPFLAAFLVGIDPFFLAHSRYLQLDGLAAAFMLPAVVCGALFVQSRHPRHLFGSAVFTGLSLLTKTYAVFLLPFVLGCIFWGHFTRTGGFRGFFSTAWPPILKWMGGVILIVFMLWPALWVSPIQSLQQVVAGARTAVTHTHENTGSLADGQRGTGQRYLSGIHFNWGLIKQFYQKNAIVILVLGFVAVPLAAVRMKDRSEGDTARLALGLAVFWVLFMTGMSFCGKTGIRYCVIAFMLLDILAAYSIASIGFDLKTTPSRRRRRTIVLSLIVTVGLLIYAGSVWMLHPYYQTHHNRLCAPQQMGWGEGLEKVADYLNRQPESDDLIVTSFYGCVLRWFFRGRVVDLGELTRRVKPDYVVFYNSQVTRYLFPVIIDKYFLNANHRPEYTARLNGIPYAWVYRTEFFDSNRPMRWLNE